MGFSEKSIDEKYKGQQLLLDRSIYGKNGPPAELHGKLFQYSVVSVVGTSKDRPKHQFRCKYEDFIINEDGNELQSWVEKGEGPSFLLLTMEAVEKGIQSYLKHLGLVNRKLNNLKEATKEKISKVKKGQI